MGKATLKGFGDDIDGTEVEIPDSLLPQDPNQRVDEIFAQIKAVKHYPGAHSMKIVGKEEARNEIKALIAQEVEAAQATRIDQYLQENPLQAPQLLAAVIYNTFMEKTNATKANMKIKNFSKNGDIKGDLSIEATLTNNTKGKK